MRSPTLLAGSPLARLVRVSVSHWWGLMVLSLQHSMSVAITAQLSPPSSEPANRAFLRLRASGLIDRSTVLESRSMRRSEEHTSELQSIMRISYAVFCLKKKTKSTTNEHD